MDRLWIGTQVHQLSGIMMRVSSPLASDVTGHELCRKRMQRHHLTRCPRRVLRMSRRRQIEDAASAKLQADTRRYAKYFHLMLEQGVYFAPSQFEAAFVSAAHGESQVEATLQAVEKAFVGLADA